MNTKVKALYDLIHACTPHERGYFVKLKRNFPAKTGVHYLAMFEVLAKMEVFDAARFDALCADNAFGQYPERVRYYLYHSLLDVMRNYFKAGSTHVQAMRHLQDASLLLKRNLPA
jgi:hypothetical protein